MGKKQELDFINKWIVEREDGFWKYYVKHFGGVAMIMIGIFVASCIGKKEIDAIYLLISIMVGGAFPFFAWGINEIRMKIHDRRNGGGKIE
jgi:hypothetical protein